MNTMTHSPTYAVNGVPDHFTVLPIPAETLCVDTAIAPGLWGRVLEIPLRDLLVKNFHREGSYPLMFRAFLSGQGSPSYTVEFPLRLAEPEFFGRDGNSVESDSPAGAAGSPPDLSEDRRELLDVACTVLKAVDGLKYAQALAVARIIRMEVARHARMGFAAPLSTLAERYGDTEFDFGEIPD
jgi:hypothetical protein